MNFFGFIFIGHLVSAMFMAMLNWILVNMIFWIIPELPAEINFLLFMFVYVVPGFIFAAIFQAGIEPFCDTEVSLFTEKATQTFHWHWGITWYMVPGVFLLAWKFLQTVPLV